MVIGGTVLVGLMTMVLALQNGPLWQFLAGFAVLGSLGSTAAGYAKARAAGAPRRRSSATATIDSGDMSPPCSRSSA